MRITFLYTKQPGDRAASLILCNGGVEGPSKFLRDGEGIIQVVPYPRADEPGIFGRGNRTSTVSFEVNRTFGNIISAQTYVADVGAIEGLDGQLRLELPNNFGGFTGVRWVRFAACQHVRAMFEGVTAYASFVFIGGKMTP